MPLAEQPDPLKWACPECDAQPKEECVWRDVPHEARFHASRLEAAIFWGDGDSVQVRVPDSVIERAVDELL